MSTGWEEAALASGGRRMGAEPGGATVLAPGIRAAVVVALAAATILTLAGPAHGQASPEPIPEPSPSTADDPAPGGLPAFRVPTVPDAASAGGPSAGEGVDGLLRGPDLRGNDVPTLYERYGTTALQPPSGPGIRSGTDRALNAIAIGIWTLVQWLVGLAIGLVQWSFSFDLVAPLAPTIGSTVGSLYRDLFRPLVLPVLVLAGGWATYHGVVRRRTATATQGLTWTVASLGVATAFLLQPVVVVEAANEVSVGLSQGVLAAVSVADGSGISTVDPIEDAATYDGGIAATQLRQSGDQLYRQTLLVPWLVMSFGDLRSAAEPGADGRPRGEILLDAQLLEADEAPADDRRLRDELERDLAEDDPQALQWFLGHRPAGRIVTASLTLATTILYAGLLALIAAAVFLAQLGVVMLVLLAPIPLILGIFPGWRRLGRRWLELTVALLIRRVAYAAALAVLLVVVGAIAAEATALGWLLATSLQAGVAVAVFVYRRELRGVIGAAEPSRRRGRSGRDATGRGSRSRAGKEVTGNGRRRRTDDDTASARLAVLLGDGSRNGPSSNGSGGATGRLPPRRQYPEGR